jgi:hypothetical protein
VPREPKKTRRLPIAPKMFFTVIEKRQKLLGIFMNGGTVTVHHMTLTPILRSFKLPDFETLWLISRSFSSGPPARKLPRWSTPSLLVRRAILVGYSPVLNHSTIPTLIQGPTKASTRRRGMIKTGNATGEGEAQRGGEICRQWGRSSVVCRSGAGRHTQE